MKSITGKPIKFVGVGEKLDGLEPFHPERIASRILGMGDVVTLVEKAQETMELGEAAGAPGQAGLGDLHAGGHAGPVPPDAEDGKPPVHRGDDPRAEGLGRGGEDRREGDEAGGGDHPLHDADGEEELPHHRPAPPDADGAAEAGPRCSR